MIRILHTADWHLGQTFFGYDRAEEHKAFLDWLAEEIRQNEIDALVIAGDVFDVSNPSAASQRIYYEFIYRVTAENPKLQIVIVAGNHDSAARLEAPLPLLQAMRTEVRGVVRKLEGGEIDYDHLTIELKNREGEVEVLCMAVPFLRQGDYPVVETEGNPYMEGVRELYARLLQRLWARRKTNQAILAVGHLQATGSEIAEKDYSERTVIGGLECVSPDTFSEKIAYTALGHIHKAQRVSGRENVRYAGSPIPMSFAEKHYHHGVVMVTLDEGCAVDIRRIECPQSIPLISVPGGEAASPEKIIEILRDLPEVDGEAPYLEVKVLLEEPEPMLRQEIEEALAGKKYRLARIVSAYRQEERVEKEVDGWKKGLQEMSPLQIAQSAFEKVYQAEMPADLTDLFHSMRPDERAKVAEGAFELSFPEIVKFVEKNFRTLANKKNRAIAGLSMGSFHSCNISKYYPDMFDYVGLFSGASTGNDKSTCPVYTDFEGKLKTQFAKKPALYFIACGKTDFVYKGVADFRKLLDDNGYKYEYLETGEGHIWRNWRIYLTEFAPKLFK